MSKRALKFRAWDSEKKSMAAVWYIRFQAWRDNDIDELVLHAGEASDHGTYEPANVDNVVLLQFTGLKDKNGVELYFDSSVVTIDRDPTGAKWMATKDDFGIPCFLTSAGVMGPLLTFQDVFLGAGDARRDGFTILGNIHETPDLLSA